MQFFVLLFIFLFSNYTSAAKQVLGDYELSVFTNGKTHGDLAHWSRNESEDKSSGIIQKQIRMA